MNKSSKTDFKTENERLKKELQQKDGELRKNQEDLAVIEDRLVQIIIKLKDADNQYSEIKDGLNFLKAGFYELEYRNNKGRSLTQRLTSKFPSLYILFRRNNGFKNTLTTIKGYRAIKRNNLFDIGYYLKNNGDIRVSGADPLLHYIYHGYKEGRNPHPHFNTQQYLENNEDVQKSNLNPLIHYALHGKKEGRYVGFSGDQSFKDFLEEELPDIHDPANNRKKILYVIHSGGGGTPHTNIDLMQHIQKYLDCYVLMSSGKEVILGIYEDNQFKQLFSWVIRSKWSAQDFYIPEFRKIYFDVLNGLKIDLIHIRHLIKHTFDLPVVAANLKIPVIVSFHDFYFVCPSYNLLDDRNSYCAGECSESEGQCKVPMRELHDLPFLKEFVKEWRNEVSKIFYNISAFVTTAQIVKEIFISVYPELSRKEFIIIEHGRDFQKSDTAAVNYEIPSKEGVIKILLPGNIHNQKGADLIKALKKLDVKNRLEFHFMGRLQGGLEDYGINHGPYERDDFNKMVNKIKPSFIGIFTICPETYCHTLSEAWNSGVPILTTKLGAQKERLNKNGGGWFIDHTNPSQAYDEIIRIARSPEEYLEVAEQVKKIEFRSTKEMAQDYMNLYNRFLYHAE